MLRRNALVADSGYRNILRKVPSGSVLHMPALPEGFEQGVIKDYSGNNNHGTITGATWTRLPSGLRTLDYSGTDDVTVVTDNDSLDITTQITILAWINADTFNSSFSHHVITKRDTGTNATNYGINFEAGAGNKNILQFYLYDAGFVGYAADSATTTGVWHLVGATFDNVTKAINLIQDGAFVKTGTFNYAMAANTANVSIGAVKPPVSAAQEEFDGKIALVRVFTRVMDAGEVASTYNREYPLFGV